MVFAEVQGDVVFEIVSKLISKIFKKVDKDFIPINLFLSDEGYLILFQYVNHLTRQPVKLFL